MLTEQEDKNKMLNVPLQVSFTLGSLSLITASVPLYFLHVCSSSHVLLAPHCLGIF
jgi:hypothetical protein